MPQPAKRRKLSPEEAIVHWIADTLLSFVSVEHQPFHQVIDAHSGTPSIQCGNTIRSHVMKKADNAYATPRAEIESSCSTIFLT
jgi:hypothetical protein